MASPQRKAECDGCGGSEDVQPFLESGKDVELCIDCRIQNLEYLIGLENK